MTGPRGVPGSQRVRLHREPEIDLNALLPSWLLRAADGSRSGGGIKMYTPTPSAHHTAASSLPGGTVTINHQPRLQLSQAQPLIRTGAGVHTAGTGIHDPTRQGDPMIWLLVEHGWWADC